MIEFQKLGLKIMDNSIPNVCLKHFNKVFSYYLRLIRYKLKIAL